MIDGSPTDGAFIDGVIDINECDSVPTVLIDLSLVLVYYVPVLVEIGVPVGSEGFVVSKDRPSLIGYFGWCSAVNGAASEIH